MKHLLNIFLVVSGLALSSASSCNKNEGNKNDCENVACTMMFAMINLNVTDSAGQPVKLDEAYTVREGTTEVLTYDRAHDGAYTVLDDGYLPKLKNDKAKFIFTGKKDGAEVVKETFEISADCCHINKLSGPATVVVK